MTHPPPQLRGPALQKSRTVHPAPLRRGALFGAPTTKSPDWAGRGFKLTGNHCGGVAFYWRADRGHGLDRLPGANAEEAVPYLGPARTTPPVPPKKPRPPMGGPP